jgi:Tol biopolymer transport system component
MRADPRFENYRLYWSRCEASGWRPPVEVPFAAAPGVLEADPFVTPDGRRLYFVSSREKSDRDDLDIWMVARAPSGSWGTPERLPSPINSESPELLPRLTSDGRLFFGSTRPGGHGQGDIYVATTSADGTWHVDNVGPPVSTAAYEYEAEISPDGRHLAVVADRGVRSYIYRFELTNGGWKEVDRVRANDAVFQVGPLFSPTADRLLFAQRDDDQRSGEWFVVDLSSNPRPDWPPACQQ